jgi:hypothetical protein
MRAARIRLWGGLAARVTVLSAFALLTGCATLNPNTDRFAFTSAVAELTYQSLNAADFSETINAARRPDCYRESDWPTADLIGSHPTEGRVYGAWSAYGLAHWAISSWLDREVDATDSRAWRIARAAWHVLTIGNAAWHVARNYGGGARPFGRGCGEFPVIGSGRSHAPIVHRTR